MGMKVLDLIFCSINMGMFLSNMIMGTDRRTSTFCFIAMTIAVTTTAWGIVWK